MRALRQADFVRTVHGSCECVWLHVMKLKEESLASVFGDCTGIKENVLVLVLLVDASFLACEEKLCSYDTDNKLYMEHTKKKKNTQQACLRCLPLQWQRWRSDHVVAVLATRHGCWLWWHEWYTRRRRWSLHLLTKSRAYRRQVAEDVLRVERPDRKVRHWLAMERVRECCDVAQQFCVGKEVSVKQVRNKQTHTNWQRGEPALVGALSVVAQHNECPIQLASLLYKRASERALSCNPSARAYPSCGTYCV